MASAAFESVLAIPLIARVPELSTSRVRIAVAVLVEDVLRAAWPRYAHSPFQM